MLNGASGPVRRRAGASLGVVRAAPTDHLPIIDRIFDQDKPMNREIDNDCGEAHATLAELVRDPLIGLVMKSDGVDRRSIERLFERIARERPNATRRAAVASRPAGS